MTRHFFQRINDLEKIIIEENEFNSLKEESQKILNYINEFKQEHYKNVMEYDHGRMVKKIRKSPLPNENSCRGSCLLLCCQVIAGFRNH